MILLSLLAVLGALLVVTPSASSILSEGRAEHHAEPDAGEVLKHEHAYDIYIYIYIERER